MNKPGKSPVTARRSAGAEDQKLLSDALVSLILEKGYDAVSIADASSSGPTSGDRRSTHYKTRTATSVRA